MTTIEDKLREILENYFKYTLELRPDVDIPDAAKAITTELEKVVDQVLDPSLQDMIDAGLFPTPSEWVKMVGLLEWQRAALAKLMGKSKWA
jgi:hypothetical protein